MKFTRIIHTVTGHVYTDTFDSADSSSTSHASTILQTCFTTNNNSIMRIGSLVIPQRMIECIEIKESK